MNVFSSNEAIFVCNTSNQDDVETTVQKIKQQMGHIDILLNCAGVVCLDRSEDISQEDWDSTLMVNLTAFIMAQVVGREMIK